MFSPPSTLSSRKEYGCARPAASKAILRYAETGVSRSATTSRQTGIRLPSPASRRNSSIVGVNMLVPFPMSVSKQEYTPTSARGENEAMSWRPVWMRRTRSPA